MKRFLLVCLLLAGVGSLKAAAPAFPTAEGYGRNATGGRGGQVVYVTNLLDDANGTTEGSLRWALKQYSSQPITVVFRVGGIIKLVADLRSSRTAGTTIAGQTAPGDGITIRGAKCNFGGSQNLVIRNIRFRIGLKGDTAFAAGGSIGIENASNWIIDHCEFGWSGEENMTIYDNKLTTIQWSLVHEGLYACGHSKGVRSYGCQWGGQTATFHHNLLAHNQSRTPRFNGARSNDWNVLIDYVNNVNYNWGSSGSCYGSDLVEGSTNRTNIVNNYYKPGPARPGTSSSVFTVASFNSGQSTSKIAVFYMNGNYMEGSANTANNTNNYNGLDAGAYASKGIAKTALISATPFAVANPVHLETAAEAYQSVLAKVGVFPRDTTARRIINEVRTGKASGKGTTQKYLNSDGTTYSNSGNYNVTKGIIDNPSLAFGPEIAYPSTSWTSTITDADADGMDDAWETANGLDPANAADRNTTVPSGYTMLEVYLCSLMGENISLTSGIEETVSGKAGCFRLPGTNELRLTCPEAVSRYVLHDLSGKCLRNVSGNDITSVGIGSLNPGCYLLSLGTETGRTYRLKFSI